MKYRCVFFIVTLVTALLLATAAAAETGEEEPKPAGIDAAEIISAAAVLMDAETGQVLFDKNMSQRVYPASTTKIMTGLLVTESADPDDIVTVNQSAVDIDEWDSASIDLAAGETLTVDSALYALMLPSANDAANALAEHVAGSQAAFAELMNERALEIGAANTHFTNAHGLHEAGHYTTAYDMALITRHAAESKRFMTYFGAAKYVMPATNLQPMTRNFTNYQSMLVRETDYYDPIVEAGKVGFTGEAKHTMSTVARKNGRTLICVVMSSSGRLDKFTDTKKLLQYGFDEFRQITLEADSFTMLEVPMENGGSVDFRSDGDFTAWLRNDLSLSDVRINFRIPDEFGPDDLLPTSVEVVTDDAHGTLPARLGLQPLVTELYLEGITTPTALTPPGSAAGHTEGGPNVQLIIILVLSGILFLLVCLLLWRYHQLQKRRRERMERLNRRIKANYSKQT